MIRLEAWVPGTCGRGSRRLARSLASWWETIAPLVGRRGRQPQVSGSACKGDCLTHLLLSGRCVNLACRANFLRLSSSSSDHPSRTEADTKEERSVRGPWEGKGGSDED